MNIIFRRAVVLLSLSVLCVAAMAGDKQPSTGQQTKLLREIAGIRLGMTPAEFQAQTGIEVPMHIHGYPFPKPLPVFVKEGRYVKDIPVDWDGGQMMFVFFSRKHRLFQMSSSEDLTDASAFRARLIAAHGKPSRDLGNAEADGSVNLWWCGDPRYSMLASGSGESRRVGFVITDKRLMGKEPDYSGRANCKP